MKLHLPKMLLTAVLAAVCYTPAWAGTGLHNNQNYLIGGTDTSGAGVNASTVTNITEEVSTDDDETYLTTFIDEINACALSSFNVWADSPDHARTNAEIKNWLVQDGATITVSQSSWKVNNQLKWFNTLNINKLTGSANLNITTADHVVAIEQVEGALLNISNSGTLTIGTADSTTTISGTITNSGTLTILGTAELSINDYSTFEAISGGESTYSYNNEKSEGFRKVAAGTWYLVKENTGTLNITEQDGWTVNRNEETNAITSITFSSQAITGSVFRINGSDYDEATLMGEAGAGVTETTKYEISAGSLTLAGDISTADRLCYKGGTLNIGNNTLTIAKTTANPSLLLKNTSGSGTIVLQAIANIAQGETLQFTGKLSLATGGTLNLGNAKEGVINISNVNAIEFAGGTLNYYGLDSTLNSISTTAAGGTITIKDYKNSHTAEIVFANDTNLVGDLTIDTAWKSYLNIDHLTGGGSLILKAVTYDDAGGANISIDSMSGYTGIINLQGKYEETTNSETGAVTTTSKNKVKLTATLDEGYTLESSRVLYNKEECCSLVLKGSGTYELAQGSASMGIATLDSTWTGTVVLDEATLTDADLNAYGNASSAVELKGVTGSLQEGTVSTNIVISNPANAPGLKVTTAGKESETTPGTTEAKTIVFAGKVTSANPNAGENNRDNLVIETGSSVADTYKFSNDVSGWNGNFIVATNAAAKVEYADTSETTTTIVNNGIIANGGTVDATIAGDKAVTYNGEITNQKWQTKGTLNLIVNNTSTEGVTFTNTVKADTATIAAGSKATFTGTANLDTLSLGAGLSADSAAVTTSGALTLGSISLDLSSYTTAGSFSLVSITGDGSISWTEGSWIQEGLADGLTANVGFNETRTGLSLTISEVVAPEVNNITTTVAGVHGLFNTEENMLTLNVAADACLDGVTSVTISGISDDIMKDILGLDGLPEDGMVGITLRDAEGHTFVGGIDGALEFQGNTGVYTGEVSVGSATQYNVAYIPEPTTATLSLLALMGLAARRRRK